MRTVGRFLIAWEGRLLTGHEPKEEEIGSIWITTSFHRGRCQVCMVICLPNVAVQVDNRKLVPVPEASMLPRHRHAG